MKIPVLQQTGARGASTSSAAAEVLESKVLRETLRQNANVPCVPRTDSGTFTITTAIPPACLPIPAGATIDCPAVSSLTCTAGAPVFVAPGQVNVPVTLTPAPFTVNIRRADGTLACTIFVPQPGPATLTETVSCPVTENVRCFCGSTISPCQSCTFNSDRTAVICQYSFTLDLECTSVSPIPPPTEIVCILVDKVFDFCFEQDTGLQNCVPIPASCLPVAAGSTAACNLIDTATVHPICTTTFLGPTGVDGLANVRVTVTVPYTVTIFNPNGTVHCTFPTSGHLTFTFTKTIVICGPTGTVQDCTVTAQCGNCAILLHPDEVAPEVCCEFNLCILVESTATVKLLVPANGFCAPTVCRTAGFPPITCPPSPLFPPQCVLLDGV